MVARSKWDDFDADAMLQEEDDVEGAVLEDITWEVIVPLVKVRKTPAIEAAAHCFKHEGERVVTDATKGGWVRLRDREKGSKCWMQIQEAESQNLGVGQMLKRLDCEAPPPPSPQAKPASAPPPPVKLATAPKAAAAAAPAKKAGKKNVDYSKWDSFNDLDDQEEPPPPKPPPKKTPSAKMQQQLRGELDDPFADAQRAQFEESCKGFDRADFERQRIESLEASREVGLADAELKNEQMIKDAKSAGRQGNIVVDDDGQMKVVSDDELGAHAGKYWWGQNEAEVTIKCHVPAGTKSKAVSLTTKSRHVRLAVNGELICEGELHRTILSDESMFELSDGAGGERLLTVTMAKSVETRGQEHWKCAIKGEAKIDPSKFGPAIVSVNPGDPRAMEKAFE